MKNIFKQNKYNKQKEQLEKQMSAVMMQKNYNRNSSPNPPYSAQYIQSERSKNQSNIAESNQRLKNINNETYKPKQFVHHAEQISRLSKKQQHLTNKEINSIMAAQLQILKVLKKDQNSYQQKKIQKPFIQKSPQNNIFNRKQIKSQYVQFNDQEIRIRKQEQKQQKLYQQQRQLQQKRNKLKQKKSISKIPKNQQNYTSNKEYKVSREIKKQVITPPYEQQKLLQTKQHISQRSNRLKTVNQVANIASQSSIPEAMPNFKHDVSRKGMHLSDNVIQMIEEIQDKALSEIQSLRQDKILLLKRINEEINCHNELKRYVNQLQQKQQHQYKTTQNQQTKFRQSKHRQRIISAPSTEITQQNRNLHSQIQNLKSQINKYKYQLNNLKYQLYKKQNYNHSSLGIRQLYDQGELIRKKTVQLIELKQQGDNYGTKNQQELIIALQNKLMQQQNIFVRQLNNFKQYCLKLQEQNQNLKRMTTSTKWDIGASLKKSSYESRPIYQQSRNTVGGFSQYQRTLNDMKKIL